MSIPGRPKLPLEVRRVVQRWVRCFVFASLAFVVLHSVLDAIYKLWATGGVLDVTRNFGFRAARILP